MTQNVNKAMRSDEASHGTHRAHIKNLRSAGYYVGKINGGCLVKAYYPRNTVRTQVLLGTHSFSVASPKIWNSLPAALRSCNCPSTFRPHLNTHIHCTSNEPLRPPKHLPRCASDSPFADIVCVYKFHLLTYYCLT